MGSATSGGQNYRMAGEHMHIVNLFLNTFIQMLHFSKSLLAA
jgi:hypothetical protein